MVRMQAGGRLQLLMANPCTIVGLVRLDPIVQNHLHPARASRYIPSKYLPLSFLCTSLSLSLSLFHFLSFSFSLVRSSSYISTSTYLFILMITNAPLHPTNLINLRMFFKTLLPVGFALSTAANLGDLQRLVPKICP